MKAIRVESFGGPEVLRFGDVPDPQAGPGQLLVRVEAAGVNFIDVYHRTGLYPNPLPLVPGQEGAGIVERRRSRRRELPRRRSRRVGVEPRLVRRARARAGGGRRSHVPAAVDARTAAAVLLQGMTAHYLCTSTYPLKPGDTCLVHAAAGGVGLLLVQMAKQRGARVIGTVGTEEKARLAREAGADEVVLYDREDFLAAAKAATGGRGVEVVYDGVGKATAAKSLDCLAPLGMMVFFGNASGPVDPIDPLVLTRKGSLFLTRPTLGHYVADRASLERRAGEVLGARRGGPAATCGSTARSRSPRPPRPTAPCRAGRRRARCCSSRERGRSRRARGAARRACLRGGARRPAEAAGRRDRERGERPPRARRRGRRRRSRAPPGPSSSAESDALVRAHGPVPVGGAAVTGAGRLPFRAVIHAVGPQRGDGDEESTLAAAIDSALARAEERGFSSVAFPGRQQRHLRGAARRVRARLRARGPRPARRASRQPAADRPPLPRSRAARRTSSAPR